MIKQCRFSSSVKFFEKGFCERWDVTPYRDANAPCLFAGVYNQGDVDVINKHNGFKLVLNTGGIRDVFYNINPKNVVVVFSASINMEKMKSMYKHRCANFQMKDYSMFEPNVLGNMVYIYVGNNAQKNIYGYELMKQVEEKIPYEVIYGMQGNSIEQVKKEYYDNSFVNMKLSIIGGFTTAAELAYMGRMSVSNARVPFCIGYRDTEDIVKIIKEEAEKIGTVQDSKIGNWITMDKKWKELSTWD